MTATPLRALIWVAVSSRAQAADDKVSLVDQERLTRDVCDRSGWQIVDILRVPGHSRNYIDIHECAADMRGVGIDAFDKLMEHWRQRDFDVLVVYDANRFARTQTLTSYVVETTILQGATIYAINGGMVNGDNYRMWISMTGYKSASEIDALKYRRLMAIDDYAKRGLPTGPRVPWVFERVRDPRSGKTTGLQLSEGMRAFVDTAARLIVEGVSWPKLPGALRECGYAEPDGKLIGIGKLQRLFYHPYTWGHSAARYSKRADNSESSDYVRLWALGPEYAPPPNALMYYNMTPPLFDGEFGAALKAELIRRTHIRGATRPADTPFCSGLVVCGECGMRMTVQTVHRGGRYMRCLRPFQKRYTAGRDCNHRTHYRFDNIRNFMREIMRPYFSVAVPSHLNDAPIAIDVASRDEIERLTTQRARLIRLQAEAPDDDTAAAYSDEVALLGKRIRALRRDADRADAIMIGRLAELESQRQTHAAIREMGPEKFWALSDRELNQWLRRAFGAAYVEAHNGKLELVTP